MALVNSVIEEGLTRSRDREIADALAEPLKVLNSPVDTEQRQARRDKEKARINSLVKESRELLEEYRADRRRSEAEAEKREVSKDVASGRYVEINP